MTVTRQPFLQDAVIVLHAPTQVWSRDDGDMRAPIDGVYHGDRRMLAGLQVAYGAPGAPPVAPEAIASRTPRAARAVFDAVLREIDDPAPDPHLRMTRTRTAGPGVVRETIVLASALPGPVDVEVTVRMRADFGSLADVKAGLAAGAAVVVTAVDDGVRAESGDGAEVVLTAPDAALAVDGAVITLAWSLTIPARGSVALAWRAQLHDPALVVAAAPHRPWTLPATADSRLNRWLAVAADDLDALRLALPDRADDAFLAAGAPWFFTLFGRDSLWAARLVLPMDVALAASTLRVLARLQGTKDDPATEEQPGKIAHELRAGTLELPGEGIVLPPLYYGTVDATALWVCLLVEAARAGMPDAEVRDLLPHLRAALDWLVVNTGDGFLSYIDRTGRGLANQGWKDSGDSIQWRDGRLAAGPIALCEVQGYAYEAAVGAADLLDRLGQPGAGGLRTWAEALQARFRNRFWVQTPEGRYPAIALDRDGRAVDTLSSNIGHLLGTGILSADEEHAVADLLVGESMASGSGIRTLSTDAAGYWPLGYHNGSVWTHDSAIIARGMAAAGLPGHAERVAHQLIDVAERFAYRVPELHSGDPVAVPYPAACRPQAWSAAAAFVCAGILADG
ncbi:MAG TPA: glycogen debranching N-terminal domain-containing protein [Microbacterium sp.]|uniref:glycogen debranching N-terminal domain-containing protein n=1 Tax=Microbacterium sp. TaxID=51671 RepID=UPI002B45D40B|nr:glycogen debranching N-terminal domain-containing protein [Microbacterium sp.]HKT57251.1 glycogen debranching N-terminal domain-containing protein [Microbacterium sp.]